MRRNWIQIFFTMILFFSNRVKKKGQTQYTSTMSDITTFHELSHLNSIGVFKELKAISTNMVLSRKAIKDTMFLVEHNNTNSLAYLASYSWMMHHGTSWCGAHYTCKIGVRYASVFLKKHLQTDEVVIVSASVFSKIVQVFFKKHLHRL